MHQSVRDIELHDRLSFHSVNVHRVFILALNQSNSNTSGAADLCYDVYIANISILNSNQVRVGT
jgi:hypothetical protein